MVYDDNGVACNYQIIEANPVSEEYLNIKRKDAIGKLATDLYGTDEAPFLYIYAKVAETGEPISFEQYFEPMKKHFYISVFSPTQGEFATAFLDITKRKSVEEDLKSLTKRHQLAIGSAKIGIWDLDLINNALIWDKQMFNLYGIKPEEFGGAYEAWKAGVHPEDINRTDTEVQEAIAGTKKFDTQFRVVWPDGQVRFLKANGKIVNDSKGKPERMIGINWDITNRIESEQELIKAKEKAEESKANITAIIEGTDNSIWAFNRNYQILYINHVFQEEFLRSFGVLLKPGMSLIEALPEPLQPFWKPRYDRVLANEQFTLEDAVPTETGTIYIHVSFNPIIKNGKVIGGSCFGSNITERKIAEIELIEAKEKAEESEEQLKRIANNFVDGMIYQVAMPDENKRKFTYISDAVTRLYGCSPEEAIDNPDLVYGKLHPEDVGNLIKIEKEAFKNMSVFRTECRVINPDGSIRWAYYISQPRMINDIVCWDGIEVDITKQKQIEKELTRAKEKAEESEQKYRLLHENAGLGIGYISPEGIILSFNTIAADDMHGVPEDFVGKSIFDIFPEEAASAYYDRLMKSVNSNKIEVYEDHVQLPKKSKWFLSTYTKIVDSQNNILGIQIISQDITKIKESELELKKAKEKAEESDRLKSAFLANMSHEIRTPMNGILGFTNLLLQPNLSGENHQKYVDIIQKSGLRMLNTVNDIIDISRIESGQTELSFSEVNIDEQLEYLFSFFKPEAEKKELDLLFKKDKSVKDIWFTTDPDKLNSIVTNLIKNAIKFTEKGFIELGYELKKEKESIELKFYVKDSGIGIPKHRQKAIFDRFVQADIEDRHAKQGSGLGLTISKAFVEMLGGKIWVDSEEGKGSTFYFTIKNNPKSSIKSIAKNDSQPIKGENSGGNLNILVVEDDETSQHFISIVVEKFAGKITSLNSGLEAVEFCRNNSDIDLILMDIQLPGMNGYKATQEIRKFNKDVVIIAQTAYALTGDKEKAISMGCNDYVSKPIDSKELVLLIKKYFMK